MIHVALPKSAMILFKPVQHSSHGISRSHCPNVYTVIKGKRWADGGFIYGFNAAEASIDLLRQKSRRALKKAENGAPGSRPQTADGRTPKPSAAGPGSTPAAAAAAGPKVVEDISTGSLCPVSDDVIAIHNRTHVKVIY